ncbi:MAG: hypothetical protein FD150_699 [Rhodobacteraceae bacterium]|nr:MAG: hypothetical protein FD150_699 [Paracoccaceae bacterium]
MWKRIKHWWDAEGALVGLQGVSDRMLEDMGLERADLRRRVLGEGETQGVGSAPSGAAICEGC